MRPIATRFQQEQRRKSLLRKYRQRLINLGVPIELCNRATQIYASGVRTLRDRIILDLVTDFIDKAEARAVVERVAA